MVNGFTTTTLEQTCQNVKPLSLEQLMSSPASMIHHKDPLPRIVGRTLIEIKRRGRPYGVSSSQRVLSPQLLLKRFDLIRDLLEDNLGLTAAQREVVFRLLRLWAYYGQVYPKEAFVTGEPGCKKATFWRTIRILEEQGLLQRINRFLIRPHAQISNLYRFDKLLILIARYLAEHGQAFYQEWLQPYLTMPGRSFWPWAIQTPGARAAPSG